MLGEASLNQRERQEQRSHEGNAASAQSEWTEHGRSFPHCASSPAPRSPEPQGPAVGLGTAPSPVCAHSSVQSWGFLIMGKACLQTLGRIPGNRRLWARHGPQGPRGLCGVSREGLQPIS